MTTERTKNRIELDRTKWEGCDVCNAKGCKTCVHCIVPRTTYPCNICGLGSKFEPVGFCPVCGKPLTDEAWTQLERRLSL